MRRLGFECYYGRYLLRCAKPLDALACLVKAVEDEATSIAVEHHTACVQSLALVAYTSADSGVDEVLNKYSGRLDVAAIRRFSVAFLSKDVDGLERVLVETEGAFKDCEVWRLLRHYETVLKRKLCLKTSPLPADCWSDVLQCLTHPVWHALQTLCRKFDPVLAPLLHHLHSDVQKARFEYPYTRWHITVSSKSSRRTKVVHYDGILSDAVLASAVMQDVMVVEIKAANWVTDEGTVRFCFGRDGRRLETLKPNITLGLLPRLVAEHWSTANDQGFTLIVSCRSVIMSDVRLRSAAEYSQYRVAKTDSSATYEIPSDTALLTIHLAYAVSDLGTMTVIRKRSTNPESSVDEKTDV